MFGLANALRAQITIDKGKVVQSNFDYLPADSHERSTQGGRILRAQHRAANWRWRASDPAAGAGALQCDLCRDQKAYSRVADWKLGHA